MPFALAGFVQTLWAEHKPTIISFSHPPASLTRIFPSPRLHLGRGRQQCSTESQFLVEFGVSPSGWAAPWEAGSIPKTWQAGDGWHRSPRCEVTGVPSRCSSLLGHLQSTRAQPQSSSHLLCPPKSNHPIHAPACQVHSAASRDLGKAFNYLASIFFNEDMLRARQSYF